MKREYSVVKDPDVGIPGDQNAVAAGLALANRFDAQTLRLIHDTFTALELVGGQLAVAAHREKYDDWGNRLERDEHHVPGQWQTAGYIFHYENRDKKLVQIEPVDENETVEDGDSFVPDTVAIQVERSGNPEVEDTE